MSGLMKNGCGLLFEGGILVRVECAGFGSGWDWFGSVELMNRV